MPGVRVWDARRTADARPAPLPARAPQPVANLAHRLRARRVNARLGRTPTVLASVWTRGSRGRLATGTIAVRSFGILGGYGLKGTMQGSGTYPVMPS